MKIAVVMGTYRKNGAGAQYIAGMLEEVRAMPGVEADTIWLGDCGLKLCRGCMACYERGEAACPLKDGYLDAIRRLNAADAAIFYSPAFTLSITGLMKTFFDRSSYVLHRPYFKGRRAVVLTAAVAWGQSTALRTLREIVSMMGFGIVGTLAVCNGRYDQNPRYRSRVDARLRAVSGRLVRAAIAGAPVRPKLIELVTFRVQKATFGANTPGCMSDKRYWRDAGWADDNARFYCTAKISPFKEALAKSIAFGLRKTGLLPM